MYATFALTAFLIAGHLCSRQCAIAASSRSVARRLGFWTLQPIARSKRPTWSGWYATPKTRLISVATRLRVQISPRKPQACAPLLSKAGSRARCLRVKRSGAPGDLRVRSASLPPSRPRAIHWLTAPGVTPRAAAILLCFQPSRCNSQARRRRPSRQSIGCGCVFIALCGSTGDASEFRPLCRAQ